MADTGNGAGARIISMTVESASLPQSGAGDRGFDWAKAVRALGYAAMVAALVAAAGTYLILVGLTPIEPTPEVVATALVVNGVLIGFLVVLVARELISLVLARQQGRAAARLHVRIVVLFCLIAAVPAGLLATVASLTLGRGFDNWFSTQTRNVVESSLAIARAYAEQQAAQLRFDVQSVRTELEKSPALMMDDPAAFLALLTSTAATHNLTHVFLVTSTGRLVLPATNADVGQVPPPVPEVLAEVAGQPDDVLFQTPADTKALIGADSNALIGITALPRFDDLFLYAARLLDPQVLATLAA